MKSGLSHIALQKVGALVAFFLLINFAHAATTPAEQAGEMLAREHAINGKCNYLNVTNKAHLLQLVQRAEQALTERENAEAAKAAMQRGKEDGLAAACSAAEKENLNLILGAASEAILPQKEKLATAPENLAPVADEKVAAQSKTGSDAPVAPPAPISTPKQRILKSNRVAAKRALSAPRRAPRIVGNDESTTATQPRLPRRIAQGNSDSGLQAYAQITRDYYLARRCAPGDYRGLGSMYHHIVATHNSLMRNHGAGEVAAVLRRSARAARAQGC